MMATTETKKHQPSMSDKLNAIEQGIEAVKNAVEANSDYSEGKISREKLWVVFGKKDIADARREVAMAREIIWNEYSGDIGYGLDNVTKYINKNGDLIDRYGPGAASNFPRVVGFDLVERVVGEGGSSSGYFYGTHFHESYVSKSGIIILRRGAMVSAYSTLGKKFVEECHTMEWKGNRITTTTGASTTQVLKASERNGLTYIFAENGKEIMIPRSKVNEIIEGLESDLRK